MSEEQRRQPQQNADLDQVNNQNVDQANTQDASHHSEARQELAVTHNDEHHVSVVVQNHLNPSVPTAGSIAGRVMTGEGAGAAGAEVQLFFGPLTGMPVVVETADEAGRFRIDDLPPGFFSLRAVGPDGSKAEQWHLRVHAGHTCRAQVVVQPVAPVRGRRRMAGQAEPAPARD